MDTQIGIIGGSGLYQMSALTEVQEINIDTPFGQPSAPLVIGKLDGIPVVFLARHGRSHTYSPTAVPYRANIYALKSLGVRYLVSASAVGSLQPHIKPLDMVIPDQLFDLTKQRANSFFSDGLVAHISFAQPFCPNLSAVVALTATELNLPNITIHQGGAYVCIEGTAFATKAESLLYQSWGGSVIGMTNSTEAKLAREAEIAYATLALVTDYDCWHPTHASVTVEMVLDYLRQNAQNAQAIIRAVVAKLAVDPPTSIAHSALENAIVTNLSALTDDTKQSIRERLGLIVAKYM